MHLFAATLVVLAGSAMPTDPPAPRPTLARGAPTIPLAHPRLWLSTPQQRSRAAAWLAASGRLPATADHAGNAFVAVVSGDATRCAAPVAWLLNFTLPDIGNVSSDNARWHGETAALVFDWCHASLSPAQRSSIIARWNGYLDTLHGKPWGGRGFAENNYFWGYLRNNLNWAMATWHENPHAPALLDAAIDTRYDSWFIAEHAGGMGLGGVPGEGTQYGRYMLGYPAVPFLSLRDYGIDLYARTDYFSAAVYYTFYSTLPQKTPAPPSVQTPCATRYWYQMPFNDDETFLQCQPEAVRGSDPGMYILAMTEAAVGAQREHARYWYDQLRPQLPFWAEFRAPSGSGSGLQTLPLDYFAPGPGLLWARSDRSADAAVVLLQLGANGNVGHRHHDTGTFQLWRAGEWIARETTGYTDLIPGYAGSGSVDVLDTLGHNGLTFEGRGERGWTSGGPRPLAPGNQGQDPDGLARVLRLHQHAEFVYAVVDLSKPYRAQNSNDRCRYDWPFAESVLREFLFVRSLGVLVVLDRLQSGSDSLGYTPSYCQSVGFTNYSGPVRSAEAVRKAFLTHFLTPPTVDDRVVTASVGTQTARVETLWPTNAVRRVIDERHGNPASVGQYRLEVESSGTALTHFIHTVQATPAGAAVTSASLDTSAPTWLLHLDKPGQPRLTIEWLPGAASVGGRVRRDGMVVDLLQRVQNTWLDGDGPHWEVLDGPGDGIFADGFD